MRTVKTKSAGLIAIVSDGMPLTTALDAVHILYPEITIVFQEAEYAKALQLSQSLRDDSESQKSFWETLFTKKQSCSTFHLDHDFPPVVEHKSEKERIARKYAGDILETLRGRKPQ